MKLTVTHEMLKAGRLALAPFHPDGDDTEDFIVRGILEAMLRAAPPLAPGESIELEYGVTES